MTGGLDTSSSRLLAYIHIRAEKQKMPKKGGRDVSFRNIVSYLTPCMLQDCKGLNLKSQRQLIDWGNLSYF